MKLSVIIVSYKVRFYIEQSLRSLLRAVDGIDTEIFVVDNHSDDGSVEFICERFPDVNVIDSSRNLGFSRANNLAMRQCEGEYILLLNPDTIVAETTIRDVLNFMDTHPKAGGAGVMMLKDNGEKAMESRRGIPTPMTSFYKMSGLCGRYPMSHRFGHYYMSYLPWDKPERIEIVSGAFFMLRHAAIDKVGMLDEDFFMYGEDIDLSYRLLKGGYENWYIPAPILHYKGESTHKSSFRYVHVFYEAMLIFLSKHYGNVSIFVSLPIKIAIYAKALLTLVRMQMHGMRKVLGFVQRRKVQPTTYLFIGSAKTIERCRQLARHHGLDAQFVTGTSVTLPSGHVGLDLPNGQRVFAVYDTEAYTYADIFRIFSQSPSPSVLIGTYDPQTKTVITSEEVMK